MARLPRAGSGGGRGRPGDPDLSWSQLANAGYKNEICNSITWRHFPTLYLKDGFLIKIQNHTALGSNTRDVCASASQGAVVGSGVPGFEKRGWLGVACS